MGAIATRRIGPTDFQDPGTVVRADGATLVVCTARGEFRARRAVSCLVAPEAGDLVLLATAGEAGCFVLAVLERGARSTPTRLVVEGDVDVVAAGGRLALAARDDVSIAAGGAVTVAATRLEVGADEARAVVGRLAALGEQLLGEFARVKLVGDACETAFERLTSRVRRAYRYVAETDQLRAERIDYHASAEVELHGENVLATARELVKVDGGQIHLG